MLFVSVDEFKKCCLTADGRDSYEKREVQCCTRQLTILLTWYNDAKMLFQKLLKCTPILKYMLF